MNVDLLPIINNENEKLPFDGTVELSVDDASVTARVSGTATDFAGSIEIDGSIDALVTTLCARCLAEISVPLKLSIDETVDDELMPEGTLLDIDSIVLSELAVNMPIRYLCSSDCKGLCPKCGANLNITVCRCNDDENS